ncbi:hypothetical protein H5410_046450 [Solanum commersonii]|uniref:Integrase core domain containing protein n=1 Tax=Solanum commersonii TaxID=4109 RepID=A0A9J5XGI1_SOLCO|nr:hypothetical protein H5410_046450 [Solanum commersonii]
MLPMLPLSAVPFPSGPISKRSKPLAQASLTSTLVRGCSVDISPATIRQFLYGPTAGHFWSLNTAEVNYRWNIVRSGAFQSNAKQREAVILWLARYIATDGERAKWVAAPRLGIWKATLNFVAKDSGVPIWHCDKLVHPTGALDISLIQDEANVAAPRREPQVEVPPLGVDLAEHKLGATVVPLARVQKLEAQMATLLHHIQPWMQKSIAESEARMERRMERMMDGRSRPLISALMPLNCEFSRRPYHRSLAAVT